MRCARRAGLLVGLLPLLPLLGGCYERHDWETIGDPVWSEDDERIAVVKGYHSALIDPDSEETVESDSIWELWDSDVAGADQRLVASVDGGFGDLYYFRNRNRILFTGGGVLTEADVDTGEMSELAEPPPGTTFLSSVPDPTGHLIALAHRPSADATGIVLSIMDWSSRAIISGPFHIDSFRGDGWWTPEGTFFVGRSQEDALIGFEWTPDGTVTPTKVTPCKPNEAPRTTSSNISADGVLLCGNRSWGVHECTRDEISADRYVHPRPIYPFGCPDGVD